MPVKLADPPVAVVVGTDAETTFRYPNGSLIGIHVLKGKDCPHKHIPALRLAFAPLYEQSRITVLVIEEPIFDRGVNGDGTTKKGQ